MPAYSLFLLLMILCLIEPASAQSNPFGIFGRPFTSQFPLGNWHDHDSPKEFIDDNGYILNSEGRKCEEYIDGHEGYDWVMPQGTPLLAVADGEIYLAGEQPVANCPILGGPASGNIVIITTYVGTEKFYVNYAHLSQINVLTGQIVKKGDVIGYSGNTGCSLLPHLHFAVYRTANNATDLAAVDPYGWQATQPDPWSTNAQGALSLYLWENGEEPERYFEDAVAANDCVGCRSPLPITKVRWMGPNDALNPNNEFIELTIDPRFGPKKVKLNGYRIRNNKNQNVKIKSDRIFNSKSVIKIFSGRGKDSKNQIFLNQKNELWSDLGDCVRLYDKRGNLLYYFKVGNATCPVPTDLN